MPNFLHTGLQRPLIQQRLQGDDGAASTVHQECSQRPRERIELLIYNIISWENLHMAIQTKQSLNNGNQTTDKHTLILWFFYQTELSVG